MEEKEQREQEEPKNAFRGREGSFNNQNKLSIEVADAKTSNAMPSPELELRIQSFSSALK